MHQNHPAPDNEHPGQRPALVAAVMASPPHGPTAHVAVIVSCDRCTQDRSRIQAGIQRLVLRRH